MLQQDCSLSKVGTLPGPSFPSLPPLSLPSPRSSTATFLHRSAQPRGCNSLAAWPLGHCLWPKAMRVRMTVHTLRSCTHPAPSQKEPSVARCSLIKRLKPSVQLCRPFTAWSHLPLHPQVPVKLTCSGPPGHSHVGPCISASARIPPLPGRPFTPFP